MEVTKTVHKTLTGGFASLGGVWGSDVGSSRRWGYKGVGGPVSVGNVCLWECSFTAL